MYILSRNDPMISLDSVNLVGVISGYRNVWKRAKGTVYVVENFPSRFKEALEGRGLEVITLETDRFTLGKKLGRQNMVAIIGHA